MLCRSAMCVVKHLLFSDVGPLASLPSFRLMVRSTVFNMVYDDTTALRSNDPNMCPAARMMNSVVSGVALGIHANLYL